jgi:hypothetical protein
LSLKIFMEVKSIILLGQRWSSELIYVMFISEANEMKWFKLEGELDYLPRTKRNSCFFQYFILRNSRSLHPYITNNLSWQHGSQSCTHVYVCTTVGVLTLCSGSLLNFCTVNPTETRKSYKEVQRWISIIDVMKLLISIMGLLLGLRGYSSQLGRRKWPILA